MAADETMAAMAERSAGELRDELAIDEAVVDAVERLAGASVGLTSRVLGERSTASEMTLPQWRVLVLAGAAPGGLPVGEIAFRIGASAPSASRFVRRLERQGLVQIVRDSLDRRVVRVRPTAQGGEVREAIIERRRELIREALAGRAAGLPEPAAEALRRVADALEPYS
ncbi:MAG: MarR family transcriptional regulator [Chloroflexi bacterium]|nr:MarR family transcriptional regulator [Chloroflexota bacterium]